MHKVTIINLNGRAYQLEEAGYALLSEYLAQAAEQLHANPDKDEIMADFEQAIAEKCDQHLSKSKNVVTGAEIKQIIADIGPVEADEANETAHNDAETDHEKSATSDAKSKTHGNGEPQHRLYLLREGALFGGVCTGLSAYFNLDVTVIRLLFILLTVFGGGALVVVYLVLMFVVPTAETPEEKAAAHGVSFSAKELLNGARNMYNKSDPAHRWQQAVAKNRPALSKGGELILAVAKVCVAMLLIFVAALDCTLIIAMAQGLWEIALHNRIQGYTYDPLVGKLTFSTFFVAAMLTIILPLTGLALGLLRMPRIFRSKNQRTAKTYGWMGWGIATLWIVAIMLTAIIPVTSSAQVRSLLSQHHQIMDFGKRKVCVGSDQYCAPRAKPIKRYPYVPSNPAQPTMPAMPQIPVEAN